MYVFIYLKQDIVRDFRSRGIAIAFAMVGNRVDKTLRKAAPSKAVLRKFRDGRAAPWLVGHAEEEGLIQSTASFGWCICRPKGSRTRRTGGS